MWFVSFRHFFTGTTTTGRRIQLKTAKLNSMTSMFTETASFKKAVSLINALGDVKFPLLLRRIVEKLHLKDEKAFTDEEEGKLQSALKLSSDDVKLVLEFIGYIFSQASYHMAKPAVLSQQLTQLGLDEDKVVSVVEEWTANGKQVIEHLRRKPFSAKQLETINWRFGLQMAQSSRGKMKQPNAIFELGFKDHQSKDNEKLLLEFNHEELYKFYNQLEKIQAQLDSLS